MSVLLPAPFSPMTARTSPDPRVSETPWSARTPGKRLVSEWAASSGGIDGRLTLVAHLRLQVGPECIDIVLANLARGNVEESARGNHRVVAANQRREDLHRLVAVHVGVLN